MNAPFRTTEPSSSTILCPIPVVGCATQFIATDATQIASNIIRPQLYQSNYTTHISPRHGWSEELSLRRVKTAKTHKAKRLREVERLYADEYTSRDPAVCGHHLNIQWHIEPPSWLNDEPLRKTPFTTVDTSQQPRQHYTAGFADSDLGVSSTVASIPPLYPAASSCSPSILQQTREPESGPSRRKAKGNIKRQSNAGSSIIAGTVSNLDLTPFQATQRLVCRLQNGSNRTGKLSVLMGTHVDCGRTFVSIADLIAHLRVHKINESHSGDERFVCAWKDCYYEGKVGNYHRHLCRAHICEWVCPHKDCTKRYSRSQCLKQHARKGHAGEVEEIVKEQGKYFFTVARQGVLE